MPFSVLDSISEPGGTRANEDRTGSSPHAAWVLDGATDVYTEPFLPAHNDVHYLVDHLGELLFDRTRQGADTPADALLNRLAAEIGDDLAGHGFPAERTHPTCSLGLLLDRGDTVELARIGDTTLIAVGADTTELSTTFYNQREAAAVAAAGPSGLSAPEARAALLRRRHEYITGVHPEGVFSGHPDARLRTHTAFLPWRDANHVLLCTDGFARAITDHGLFPDWPTLINEALSESLAAIAKAIRDAEHRPDAQHAAAHFKRSDDLAAVLCARS
ncbi:protein phosphatase 2C domain-containing protein [Actinocrinis puniceicyclus]|uniref:Protein phosphatase 2C domain-containing protein n=1 Tax=Actinocrinis puniceicyclus TaxID=977794 RepID=A0A8J8BCA9_9ACTN|nr:protein phosphatase 2C domain-containing protein [Actinocrinis puniceicyclus]MBS2963953.1 protein phosphatase 2C domain-containing protein [Actinocrinis puniceicyclus]